MCYRLIPTLVLIAAWIAPLSAACIQTVDDTAKDRRIERYTPQRVADYRPSTIEGFLEIMVATPGHAEPVVLILPSSQIVEIEITKLGTTVTYERLMSGDMVLQRQVVVPETVLKPEQVRSLVNQSLPGHRSTTSTR